MLPGAQFLEYGLELVEITAGGVIRLDGLGIRRDHALAGEDRLSQGFGDGIALAVDYSLFILMRFREELRAGRDPEQAVDASMATSGLAVLLSGLTVIASITGIYLIGTPVLSSMATGAILAVAVAVLTSTTLIPAVLATFGKRVAKRSSWLHVSRRPDATQSRFWTQWTERTMRCP